MLSKNKILKMSRKALSAMLATAIATAGQLSFSSSRLDVNAENRPIPKTLFAMKDELDTTVDHGTNSLEVDSDSQQYIYFGAYPQSMVNFLNGNGGNDIVNGDWVAKQWDEGSWVIKARKSRGGSPKLYKIDPIKWRILQNKDGELYVLADRALTSKPYFYNGSETGQKSALNVNWKNSDLRKWLNSKVENPAQDDMDPEVPPQRQLDAVEDANEVKEDEYSRGFRKFLRGIERPGFLKAAFSDAEQGKLVAKEVPYSTFNGDKEWVVKDGLLTSATSLEKVEKLGTTHGIVGEKEENGKPELPYSWLELESDNVCTWEEGTVAGDKVWLLSGDIDPKHTANDAHEIFNTNYGFYNLDTLVSNIMNELSSTGDLNSLSAIFERLTLTNILHPVSPYLALLQTSQYAWGEDDTNPLGFVVENYVNKSVWGRTSFSFLDYMSEDNFNKATTKNAPPPPITAGELPDKADGKVVLTDEKYETLRENEVEVPENSYTGVTGAYALPGVGMHHNAIQPNFLLMKSQASDMGKVVPAMKIDLSSVLFASAVPTFSEPRDYSYLNEKPEESLNDDVEIKGGLSEAGVLSQKMVDLGMYLRFLDTENLGAKIVRNEDNTELLVTGATQGQRLVLQGMDDNGKAFYYVNDITGASADNNDGTIAVNVADVEAAIDDIALKSFENTVAWVERTGDDGLVYVAVAPKMVSSFTGTQDGSGTTTEATTTEKTTETSGKSTKTGDNVFAVASALGFVIMCAGALIVVYRRKEF